ncbi:MAG: NB-ARC domain-containing protein, partial [Ktedonobacteraceae bacterium]
MNPSIRLRLVEARKDHQWSQQELADLLGTTQHNVSRWERGQTVPGPYFRAKLCELFDKKPQELDLLVARERDATPPDSAPDTSASLHNQRVPLWHVPYPRNPFFTGRATLLQSLHELLQQNTATTLTQSYALHGLGGIGKTQIALEYAYRHAPDYSAIFWVNAETSEALLASFVTLADILNLTEQQEPDQNKIVRAVIRWLSTQKDWLLVCDNVEDLTLLRSFLPSSHQGSILLTTRLQAVGTLAQQVPVEPLTREEGLTFLLQRAKLLQPGMMPTHLAPADVSTAQAVVEVMDGLPLALDQVGAYIEETQCGLESYLQQYHQRRARLLERRGHSPQDHLASVYTTLSLSFQHVEQHNPTAVEILQFCAFLAPEAIPEEVLSVGLSQNGTHLQAFATDPWLLDEFLAVLGTYSLIHRDPATKTLSLHRLVQAVLQDRLSEQERTWWFTRCITALHRLFPEVEYE